MKKKLFLLIATFTVILSSFSVYQIKTNKVEAATIGQQLTEPEEGWTRYEETNKAFIYTGTWNIDKGTYNSGGSGKFSSSAGTKITFSFKGTDIRIVGFKDTNRTTVVNVTIDGVTEKYNPRGSKLNKTLLYEKTGMTDTVHTVVISNPNSGTSNFYDLDAIDINKDGILLEPGQKLIDSIGLVESALELNVGSSKSLVVTIEPENATNKTIKWSSSNPEIATVDDNGNVIGKSPGKVTITAETTDGSNLKATAEVTVKEVEVEGNKGILKLTSTTGDLHEYDLSRTEINNFIAWLDKKGEGKPYYEFKLNVTTGNIKSRIEYIMFDEIVSFVIDEY
ncbi:Ig-like domain-containing protein [Niallia circulans]|uniref:Ig-like domain-containing protein n=1 Tax=Niallia circulans TaxID=1397 RepID=UPI00203F291A|nr:Ig-like domain-containing protein [Niallia circulans]MCM2983841.1 Ig-like domain-containing protein [Niallia circulans]